MINISLKEGKYLLTFSILVSQVAKLNDAEKELSEISERLKASSKGKAVIKYLLNTCHI
jgi:hypothetical protein